VFAVLLFFCAIGTWSAVFCCVGKYTIPAFYIVSLLPGLAAGSRRPQLQEAIPNPTAAFSVDELPQPDSKKAMEQGQAT